MEKFAITVGVVDGKLVILDGPSADVDGQVDRLRELTTAGGKREGKGKGSVTDAVILHSSKGVIKSRRNLAHETPKAATPAAEAETPKG